MKALITGITGQDGSYLAEFLLDKGYEVYGMIRQSSQSDRNLKRINHIKDKIHLVNGDLLDQLSMLRIVDEVRPNEIYNLAAQSFVPTSWRQPILTGDFNAIGVTRLLEAIRQIDTNIRFYQASSSEMFGRVSETPQNENTPFYPRSPYGVAKTYGHLITVNYRESYNIFASSGIMFNHESPRRGTEFVTRKITNGVAKIKNGLMDKLKLGNLEAERDWGYAEDYVRAMWYMLRHDKPDNFVVATGESHSVRELCEIAFSYVDLDYKEYVVTDSVLVRPAEVDRLRGDATKAQKELHWEPKVKFKQMIEMMVDHDLKNMEQ